MLEPVALAAVAVEVPHVGLGDGLPLHGEEVGLCGDGFGGGHISGGGGFPLHFPVHARITPKPTAPTNQPASNGLSRS